MKHFLKLFLVVLTFTSHTISAKDEEKQVPQIKLYAIDCGRIDVSNFAGFSDTSEYDNKSISLVIQHDMHDFEELPKFPKYLN